MSLKLLIIGVSGTLTDSNKSINLKIANDLARLAKELYEEGIPTILWSNNTWTCEGKPLNVWLSELAGVPIGAHGYHIDGFPARKLKNSAIGILQKYGVQPYEALLVGGKDEDMMAGVSNKLLLLRPDWYGQNMDYGFSVATVSDLARFCKIFAMRKHPIFWHINHQGLHVSAAGPFSTMKSNYAVFGGDARDFAKSGLGHPDFWFYFTVSSLYFSGLLSGVKYICSYPGHNPAKSFEQNSISAVLSRLGKCFNISYYHDLLERHSLAQKSQFVKADNRSFMTQINSIRIKAKPHRNLSAKPNKGAVSLRGSNVLMVDDFITSGRSLEAARAYLEAAGASVRLYAWLKTINSSYERINGKININPGGTVIKVDPPSVSYEYADNIVDHNAPQEIQAIYDEYLAWKW